MNLLDKFARRKQNKSTSSSKQGPNSQPRVSSLPVLVVNVNTSLLQWVITIGLLSVSLVAIKVSSMPVWLDLFASFVVISNTIFAIQRELRGQNTRRQLVWHTSGSIELFVNNIGRRTTPDSHVRRLWQGHPHANMTDGFFMTNLTVQLEDGRLKHITIWRDAVSVEEYRNIRARIRFFPVPETVH